MRKKRLPGILSLTVAWAVHTAAMGQDPYGEVEKGNTSFSQGQFDEALDSYQSVVETLGERPELDFNRAAALYKLGEYEPAGNLFAKAAMVKDPPLAQAAKYNRGNCDYAAAMKVVEAAQQQPSPAAPPDQPEAEGSQPDLNAAIGKLESAIRHYGDALSVDTPPSQEDFVGDNARANIERAQRMIEVIRQMQQQQQDQQQNQNQNQNQDQQQDQEQQQEQQDQQQKQDEQKKQNEQEKSGQEQQQQDQEQQDKQQPQEDKQQKSDSEEKEKEQQEQQGGQEQDEQKDQQKQEQQEQEQKEQNKQQQPEQGQSEEQEPQEGEPSQGQPQEGRPAEMRPSQLEPILQAVRDKEKERREKRLEMLRARQRPVLRDW